MAEARIALNFSEHCFHPWNLGPRKAGWLRHDREDAWNIRFKFPAPTRGHEWKASVASRVLVKLDSALSHRFQNEVGRWIEFAGGSTWFTNWIFYIYKPSSLDDHCVYIRLRCPDVGDGSVPRIQDIVECSNCMQQVFNHIGWEHSAVTLVALLGYHKLGEIMAQQNQVDYSWRRIGFKRGKKILKEMKNSPAGQSLESYEAEWFPHITVEEIFLRVCFLGEKPTGEVIFVQMITSLDLFYQKLACHLVLMKRLGYHVVPGSFAICGCAYTTEIFPGVDIQKLKEKLYEDNLLWLLLMGKLTKMEYCVEANFNGIISLPCLTGSIDAEKLMFDFATKFEAHAGKSLIMNFRFNGLPDHVQSRFQNSSNQINWCNI